MVGDTKAKLANPRIWTPPGCHQRNHDRRTDHDRMQSCIRPVVNREVADFKVAPGSDTNRQCTLDTSGASRLKSAPVAQECARPGHDAKGLFGLVAAGSSQNPHGVVGRGPRQGRATASAIAAPISVVVAIPPRSGVLTRPSANTRSIAETTRSWEADSPR